MLYAVAPATHASLIAYTTAHLHNEMLTKMADSMPSHNVSIAH
jgi:hypothetical protein